MAIFINESCVVTEALFKKKSDVIRTEEKYHVTKYKFGTKNIMIPKSVGDPDSDSVKEYLNNIQKISRNAMGKSAATEVEDFKRIQQTVGNKDDLMQFARTIGSSLQAVVFKRSGGTGTFTMYYNTDEFGENKKLDELLGGRELIWRCSPESATYTLKRK